MSQMKLISRVSSRAFPDVAARSELGAVVLVQSRGIYTSVRNMSRESMDSGVTLDNMNPNFIRMRYAVRGPLIIRAAEIEKELAQGVKKPFKHVIKANIGDAHAMGQAPVTFIRQVLALVSHPDLIESSNLPADAKDRAKEILSSMGGYSAGSYSMSHGIEMIRKDAAAFIEQRDGHKADWNNICLTTGASTGIKSILQLLCKSVDGKPPGVMVPIPQYPLYSATLAEYGLHQVGYYLDEESNWSLDMQELERSHTEAARHLYVRALVVINPGNPTGQVLTRQNIESVIKFAHKHKMLLLADEVYQHNVYAQGSQFFSFKKVMSEMGAPYNEVELASFMSISKGYMGECGLRGGWMELMNLNPEVQAHLYKAISAMLCPSTLGQTAVDCVARPPKEGEPSYALWKKETTAILGSLSDRAKMIADTLNAMPGYTCNMVQGAMYAFPRLDLSHKAIEAAKKAKLQPDTFYAFKLLEETGICVVPGSGFGQRPDTYHFRTTILPPMEMLKEMLNIFQEFDKKFTKEFS